MPAQGYKDDDSLNFSRNNSITKGSGGRDDSSRKVNHGGSYYSSSNNDATPTEPNQEFEFPATSDNLTYPLYRSLPTPNRPNVEEGGKRTAQSVAAHPDTESSRQYMQSSNSAISNGAAASKNNHVNDHLQPYQPYNSHYYQNNQQAQPPLETQRQRHVSGASNGSTDRVSIDEEWPMEAIMHMNLELQR